MSTQYCLLFPSVTIKYHGKTSHASSYPWKGVNALDAAVLCYNNLSVLRQQMRPDWRADWGAVPVRVLALSQVTEHCVARRRHQTRWTETKHHPWLHRVLSEDPHPGWAACPERESREVLQVSCSSNWLWGINNKYSDKPKKKKKDNHHFIICTLQSF